MSCGREHERDCDEVLAQLYEFIDSELDDASCEQIQAHLDDCAPCLRYHELELLVQKLVQRSCFDPAPPALRERVLLGLRQVVQVETTRTTRGPDGTTSVWQQTTWEGPPRTL